MVIEDTAEKDAKRGATEDAEDSLDPKVVSDLEDKQQFRILLIVRVGWRIQGASG